MAVGVESRKGSEVNCAEPRNELILDGNPDVWLDLRKTVVSTVRVGAILAGIVGLTRAPMRTLLNGEGLSTGGVCVESGGRSLQGEKLSLFFLEIVLGVGGSGRLSFAIPNAEVMLS